MLLIILTAIVFLLTIFLFLFTPLRDNEETSTVLLIIGTFAIIMLIAEVVILSCVFIDNVTFLERKQQQYNSLVYQLENDIYSYETESGFTDTGNIARYNLYQDVLTWNANLAAGQKGRSNQWIGIFFCKGYEQLEFIEYPGTVG